MHTHAHITLKGVFRQKAKALHHLHKHDRKIAFVQVSLRLNLEVSSSPVVGYIPSSLSVFPLVYLHLLS